jgi:hypothetical protein
VRAGQGGGIRELKRKVEDDFVNQRRAMESSFQTT